MKCKDCESAVKDFFKCAPDKYVCVGVKEPFVIEDVNVECTEYPKKREENFVSTASMSFVKDFEPAKPYVDDEGIYVPYELNPIYHRQVISRELFVEAYNKWIKNDFSINATNDDDADCWCE